jgi:hypothetical protein
MFRVVKIQSTKAKTLIDSQIIRIAIAMKLSGHLKTLFYDTDAVRSTCQAVQLTE